MNERIKHLRKHYSNMSDSDIEKAIEIISYVVYEKPTGEIIQSGDMDRLAFENHIVSEPTHGKMIIDKKHSWKLRGEFEDFEDGGGDSLRMFKVEGNALKIKAKHTKKLKALRMPEDKD